MDERLDATPGGRVGFAAILTGAMAVGPFVGFAVGALSPLVIADLGLSRAQLGSLPTVTFGAAAAASIVGGRQVDQVDARSMMMALFVVGGAAALVVAGATSLWWLWAAAGLAGLTQAVANPVTTTLISHHLAPGRQGLQVGVKQSGVPMIQALVGFGLPPLALVAGWRGSMLTGVGLAVLGLVVVWLVLPGGVTGAARGSTGVAPAVAGAVWWLAGYTFVISMAVMAVIVFAPLYGFERVGLPAAAAGMATGVIGAAGVAARIAWSRLAERLDRPVATLTALAGIAAASVLLVAAAQRLGPVALWAGLLGFGGSAMAVSAVAIVAVVRGTPRGHTGRAAGVVGLGMFGGFMTGPLLVGSVLDRADSYTVGWLIVAALCLVALTIALLWRRSGATADASARAAA